MTTASKLDILEINRHDLQRNSNYALDVLKDLNRTYQNDTDADVQLSLQLNNSLAQFYFFSNYSASVDISTLAIEQFGAKGNALFYVMHLNLVGSAYTALKSFNEAEVYFIKALSLTQNTAAFAPVLINIYQQLIENILKRAGGDLDSAMEYTEKCLQLLKEYPRPVLENRVYLQQGNIHVAKGNYHKAMDYYREALTGFEEDLELFLMSVTHIVIGKCYIKLNLLSRAKEHLLEGLELGHKAGMPENRAKNKLYLAQVFSLENNMDEARKYAISAKRLALAFDDAGLVAEADRILSAEGVMAES